MQVHRRRFLHLLSSVPTAWLVGCTDDGSNLDGSTGGSSGTGLPPPEACESDWWTCGNYAPTDEAEVLMLEVEGAVPSELEGLYLRNGPNPLTGTSGHWFAGDGMVHGVRLTGGGAAWYRARYVDTPVLGEESLVPSQENHQANTSVAWHAGQLLALNEVGAPYALSPNDLSTIGLHTFGGALEGSMTAHPKIDPTTGELVFFGYNLFMPQVDVHFVDPAGSLTRTENIVLPEITMMHDFQLTASSVVLMDYPIAFDLTLVQTGIPFSWAPELGARIGVMPRTGTAEDVVWIETDLGYVFHTFNAYDVPGSAGQIVLDAIWYPQLWVEGPSDFSSDGELVRLLIDTMAGTVTRQTLDTTSAELPRIDPRLQGLPYRYAYARADYGASSEGDVPSAGRIAKFDVEGTTEVHDLAAGEVCDEFTFVPAAGSTVEDEGYLMGFIYNAGSQTSQLAIYDATAIGSGTVARVNLGHRVPHGFHGGFFPV